MEQTYVGFKDAKRAIAIGNRPNCYKEWCVFEYASSNSTGSMGSTLKKKWKMHEVAEQEQFLTQERELVVVEP